MRHCLKRLRRLAAIGGCLGEIAAIGGGLGEVVASCGSLERWRQVVGVLVVLWQLLEKMERPAAVVRGLGGWRQQFWRGGRAMIEEREGNFEMVRISYGSDTM